MPAGFTSTGSYLVSKWADLRHFSLTLPTGYEIINFLVVKVDNQRTRAGVPTDNSDWWNYRRIMRYVKLVTTPSTSIQDYWLSLPPDNPNLIAGWV